MTAAAHLVFSVWSYAAVALATAAAASRRGRPGLTASAWALFASFAASRLVSPHVQLNTLALEHAGLHLGLLSVVIFALGETPSAAMLMLAGLTLVQFGINLLTVLLFDPFQQGPRHDYDGVVAALFSLQLACIWAERYAAPASATAHPSANSRSRRPRRMPAVAPQMERPSQPMA